jgi:hypothetical protein
VPFPWLINVIALSQSATNRELEKLLATVFDPPRAPEQVLGKLIAVALAQAVAEKAFNKVSNDTA